MTRRHLLVLLALLPITLGAVTLAVIGSPAAGEISPQRTQDPALPADGAPAGANGAEVSTAPPAAGESETPPKGKPASVPAATPVPSGEAMGPVLLA